MFGIASRKAGVTVPGGDCASAISGAITDAVSKAANANIGRVTMCIRMITLLLPVYRQACAKRHIGSRAGHPAQGGECRGNYFFSTESFWAHRTSMGRDTNDSATESDGERDETNLDKVQDQARCRRPERGTDRKGVRGTEGQKTRRR